MTFSKSNLNLLPESLFTELTTDQAQMLEGGKRITILSVRCIQASNGSDKLFFRINGQEVMRRKIGMQTGGVANVGVAENFDGTATVRFYDNSVAHLVGGFDVSSNSNGQKTQRISGSGSIYDVTYQVTN
ncbi:hypothetical protein [Chamaesiphon sp.]|uniref:hypothetical protein n=1 Tax=Chamaesiphon sp. TaxID=2814140 RepID=UPI00359311CB